MPSDHAELRKQPFIVKFPNRQAETVHAEQVVDENMNASASYTRKVGKLILSLFVQSEMRNSLMG